MKKTLCSLWAWDMKIFTLCDCLMLLVLFLGFSSAGPGVSPNNNHFQRTGRHSNYLKSNHIHQYRREKHQVLNLTFLEDFERLCPHYCAEQSQYHYLAICISQGCKEWKTGLREGCSVVCNGTEENFREHYGCQVGCSKAVEDYFLRTTVLLGVPEPPALISDSLTSTSLQLSWDGSFPELPYLVFTIQRRLYRGNYQWETISTQPLNQTFFTVQGLKPYTQYKFRIGWILARDFPPVYSQESTLIETLPQGLPNPPEITSIQPISNSSVSVTWIPPSQPNGKLIAYKLKLQKRPHGHDIIKDIPMKLNPRGYTFSGLSPNTNYSLSISARNMEGEGLPRSIDFVTPQSSMSAEVAKLPEPQLLIQGIQDVYMQQTDLLLVEPDVIVYTPDQNISAIAAHFKYKWVYIATTNGQVVRTSLEKNQTVVIFSSDRMDIAISFMSVDWLHNKLYLVGKMKSSTQWLIKICELNGQGLNTTIFPNLGAQLVDFIADPFTGFFYWVTSPDSEKNQSGLFKMDMFAKTAEPSLVLGSNNEELGPLTVDFVNYRILIVDKGKNTVLSVTLNGEVTNIRRNTQSPQFGEALSIGMYNGIFYWTTGKTVVIEEYNSAQDSFYQNSYDVPKPCSRLMILHPDLQPVPVPMAPPLQPEVIMGTRQARVSWRPPAVIAGLGDGAWTGWKYQIRLSDNTSVSNISETQYVLRNLRPSSSYAIQILAYSLSGRGPLSVPLLGSTLRETAYNISLLWASQLGLYSTDTLGENVQQLVPAQQFIPNVRGLVISSLAWHDSASVYFTLSNGTVFHYLADNNTATSKLTQMHSITYAHSVAFDYIGQKIYWSNPKRQAILRCSIGQCDESRENIELLQVVTVAREIVIDSEKAFLLWSTGHSLEMSRLNGYNQTVLFQTGLFSGVQIMGLTLDTDIRTDTDKSKVYFITRSSTGSKLWERSYTEIQQAPTVVADFSDVSIAGPIRYFNDRLIWLQGSAEAVLMDVNTRARSSLHVDTINNITSIHVRDQNLQTYPRGLTKENIQVVPNSVSNWSIKIIGRGENFTIAWQPVSNTNFGKIYYEVLVNNTFLKITESWNISLPKSRFPPYSEIEIIIISLSFWASSKPTIVRLNTPSSKPSEPSNPRIYVEKLSQLYQRMLLKEHFTMNQRNSKIALQRESYYIKAELRWDSPLSPNGKILGYVIDCWKDSIKTGMCAGDAKELSWQIQNLQPNSTYEFAIQAYTEAGLGRRSNKVTVNFQRENPVPMLLLATSDRLEIFDIDRNSVKPIHLGVLSPISSVYLAAEESIYWINEGQDLMKSPLCAGNKTRILSLNGIGEASHLTVDWVSKQLFWAMTLLNAETTHSKYAIMALDLTTVENSLKPEPKVIMTSESAIKSLTVNPFKSVILWTTSKVKGITAIFESRTDGSHPKSFLSRDHTNCNCSNCNSIGDPITFDSNGFDSLSHGVLITNLQSIYFTDDNGCDCLPLINMSSHGFHVSNIPPYKLAANNRNVFWTAGYLYASEKPGVGITELKPSEVREITVLGPSSQPFPALSCLIPTKLEELQNSSFSTPTPHSLNLNLPLSKLENCPHPEVSEAALKYKVFYGVVGGNHISECTPSSVTSCKVISTSERLLSINDLHPFTLYTVFVTATNVYAEIMGMEPLAHKPIMLRTASGAPLPPKLLRVERLTPSTLRVVWRQPDKLNGENVWYEIHWKPLQKRISPGPGWTQVDTLAGNEWSVYNYQSNEQRKEFHFNISHLHPGCNYSIWVLAFSEKGDAFSQSENKTIMTYSNPSNITLVAATPYDLNLLWIPPKRDDIIQHQIYYKPEGTEEWINCTEIINTIKMPFPYNLTIHNLTPKTVYSFKIQAWFVGDPETPYDWPIDGFGRFNFKTLSEKPSTPGQPIAKGFGKSLYEVSWERSTVEENGPQVEIYSLECRTDYDTPVYESSHPNDHDDGMKRRVKRDWPEIGKSEFAEKLVATSDSNVRIEPVFTQWNIVYNGTEPRWKVVDLKIEDLYDFRVRAKNIYGWSDYSPESGTISLASLTVVAEPQPIGVIFGTVSLAILILSIIGVLMIYVYRRNSQEKPSLQSSSSSERREVELATLRELPGGSNFIHQSNILYAAGDLVLDLELSGVPQIRRNHISFTKFLGSGAFGEVYEGIALSLPSASAEDNRVAIKTLRKGASPNEKLEFIQEAKLMTQFRHPHILQLLGICVDTDPCCLLLELMDGGDLLSYLRSNRPHLGSSIVLRMCDLLKMCVDVAKGCVYLEDMHFVHRDIAARNCLVRIVQNQNYVGNSDDGTGRHPPRMVERVVKIGDFGLARDVYRNDYYRKEGEGLLPVRWMAPESLIDGVYTTQSDVWAFGVLLWEIVTLGQQPYPARNNLEVLQYVRAGGRLHQPSHCPDRLSQLMLQCWEFNPDNRPSFKYCLTEMEIILQDFQGELHNSTRSLQSFDPSGPETKASYHRQDDSDDVFPAITVQPICSGVSTTDVIYSENDPAATSFPKYLEVLSGSNSENSPMHSLTYPPNTDEGYEIPLPKKPPRNPKNIQHFNKLAPKHRYLTSDSASDDIGVPSPTYWNTGNQSVETVPIFPHHNRNNGPCPESDTINKNQLPQYHQVSSSSFPTRDCYSKSKSYLNARRLGLIGDLVQQDYDLNCDGNPSHFRNLLASTTSEDADIDGDYDYSECEISSSTGCVSFPDLKLHVIPDEGMEIGLRSYEGNADFPLQCNSLNTCGHARVGRLPVSLSDSGNGSVDVDSQMCSEETENLRECDSGGTSRDPEYLSMYLQTRSQILDRRQHNDRQVGIAEDQSFDGNMGCNDIHAHNEGYLGNGLLYDDADDIHRHFPLPQDSRFHQPIRFSHNITSRGNSYAIMATAEPNYYDNRARIKINAGNSG